MPAIFPNIPWYVETLDCESDNSVMELELGELETVLETVVERYQEQPDSRLLVL